LQSIPKRGSVFDAWEESTGKSRLTSNLWSWGTIGTFQFGGSAGKGEEGAKLRAEAEAEFSAAIERTDGITVAEYNEIGGAARKDQALMSQLRQIYLTRSKTP
jgi:hypothetical protein